MVRCFWKLLSERERERERECFDRASIKKKRLLISGANDWVVRTGEHCLLRKSFEWNATRTISVLCLHTKPLVIWLRMIFSFSVQIRNSLDFKSWILVWSHQNGWLAVLVEERPMRLDFWHPVLPGYIVCITDRRFKKNKKPVTTSRLNELLWTESDRPKHRQLQRSNKKRVLIKSFESESNDPTYKLCIKKQKKTLKQSQPDWLIEVKRLKLLS